jgi:hypothetical protein
VTTTTDTDTAAALLAANVASLDKRARKCLNHADCCDSLARTVRAGARRRLYEREAREWRAEAQACYAEAWSLRVAALEEDK